jgi:putative ABC transport system permease protein
VDADIHRVLEIPVLRGRSFTAQDGPDAPAVAVINESMARRYFPGEDPIGRRISVRGTREGKPFWQQIVGVVRDIHQRGLDADVSPEIQVPYTQSPIGQLAILVRTEADPAALTPAIRAELRALDPHLPLTFIQTMDDVLAKSLAARQFSMRVLTVFAAVALLVPL